MNSLSAPAAGIGNVGMCCILSNDYFLRKQPLITIAEISLKAFVAKFRFVLLTALLIVVPYNIVLLLIPLPTAVDLQNYLQTASSSSWEAQNLLALPEVKNMMKYAYSILAATIVFNPLSTAVCAYLAKQHITEKAADFPGLIDSSIGRWGKHIVTSVIYNLFIGLCIFLAIALLSSGVGALFGFILLVPTVIYGVGMSFHTIIAATSDRWALNAVKESYRIMKHQIVGAIGFFVLTSVLGYFFSLAFISLLEALAPLFGSLATSGIFATGYYFLGGVVSDTLKLFLQILTAVWFFNRFYASERINAQNLQ